MKHQTPNTKHQDPIAAQAIARQRAYIRETSKEYPEHCVPLPREQWPAALPLPNEEERSAVWRSREFLVQGFINARSGVVRLSINRVDMDRHGKWKEGISWDELQRLKRECGYGERDAFEVYPPDRDVVNVANMRHLWVLPAGQHLTCAWRLAGKSSGSKSGYAAEKILTVGMQSSEG